MVAMRLNSITDTCLICAIMAYGIFTIGNVRRSRGAHMMLPTNFMHLLSEKTHTSCLV